MSDDDLLPLLPLLLLLERQSGRLYWRERAPSLFSGADPAAAAKSWNTKFAGREALTAIGPDGYRRGSILGRLFLAHRVVWALANGRWPEEGVDHVNHDGQDNRPENLRAVSHRENMCNQSPHKNNTSGVTGVSPYRGKWQAHIVVNRKKISLGTFAVLKDAAEARARAEAAHGFHPNHGRIAA